MLFTSVLKPQPTQLPTLSPTYSPTFNPTIRKFACYNFDSSCNTEKHGTSQSNYSLSIRRPNTKSYLFTNRISYNLSYNISNRQSRRILQLKLTFTFSLSIERLVFGSILEIWANMCVVTMHQIDVKIDLRTYTEEQVMTLSASMG